MVETIKMSSRGQIVIPQHIRDDIHAREGSLFAVMNSQDSIVLKKLQKPSKEELIKNLKQIAKEGEKRAKELGIKESDVNEMIHRSRKRKS